MNILLLSYNDIEGGAARAAYRLFTALKKTDLNARMLVQNKTLADPSIEPTLAMLGGFVGKAALAADRSPLLLYPRRQHTDWGANWFPRQTVRHIRNLKPDLLHLHWVSAGYLPILELMQIQTPIVWTLHDMWPLTGGCHYDQGCNKYRDACGACPLLGSKTYGDLSHCSWLAKSYAWRDLDMTLIAPSRWMAACAQSSPIFRHAQIKHIPNGLDVTTFKPIQQVIARDIMGLPQDKKIILFGAVNSTSSPRKGFPLLQQSMELLGDRFPSEDLEIVVFGATGSERIFGQGIKVTYSGNLYDEYSLALLYSASDVFVAPSIQDNLPNTVVEALACGVPCVAFNIGGLPDLIEHQQTGYLAEPFRPEDLAHGIAWVLEDQARWKLLSRNARHKAECEFDISLIAQKHTDLYRSLLQ